MVAPLVARGGHEVIAPDLRGFGLSDCVDPSGYYHFPDYVADVAQLVSRLPRVGLPLSGIPWEAPLPLCLLARIPTSSSALRCSKGWDLSSLSQTRRLRGSKAGSVDCVTFRSTQPLTSLQEAVERLCLHHPGVPREVIETRARLLHGLTILVGWFGHTIRCTEPPPRRHSTSARLWLPWRALNARPWVVSGGPRAGIRPMRPSAVVPQARSRFASYRPPVT